MTDNEIFAKNLNKYMEINEKSRRDIEAALGYNYYTITDWVKGRKMPRMDKIKGLADYFGIKPSDLIEEKATEETKIKSKVAVDLTKRLGSDKEFLEVVKRIHTDNEFFELTKVLYGLSPEQIESVKNMLGTFFK